MPRRGILTNEMLKMKTRSLIALSLLFAIRAICGPTDLAKAIHYTPPPHYYGGVVTHSRRDPGDNPLSLDSPEFLHYSAIGVGSGEIIFQLGLIGAYVGQGKVVHFLPVTPSLMKTEMEDRYKAQFPNLTPATVETIGGLTAVNSTARRPNFFRFCWIQVDTNIAVKVTAIASDAGSFQAVTNSIKTIRIDRDDFFNALKPIDANILTNYLERVEVGHIEQNGQKLGVCVFYTKEGIYSFTVALTFNPADDLKSSMAAFERLREFSSVPNALRLVVIDIAPEFQQTSLIVEAETNVAAIARLQIADMRSSSYYFHTPPSTLIWHLWKNQIPKGFQKEAEYKMNAILYVRTEPSDDD